MNNHTTMKFTPIVLSKFNPSKSVLIKFNHKLNQPSIVLLVKFKDPIMTNMIIFYSLFYKHRV